MSDNRMQAFNQKVIEEFRGNAGVVGGPFENAAMMLLNTVGARSGQPRTNPLVYMQDGDDLIIFASYAGGDKHPPCAGGTGDDPVVGVEVGTSQYSAQAQVVAEPERTELYARMAAATTAFAEYQAKTTRVIPVVRLVRT